jgi:clan AA aspartic protease (TIGR02281 family)
MRFIILASLALLAACAEPPRELPCGLLHAAELDVVSAGRAPLVNVSINGQSAALIMDTGAQTSVLTRAAVQRLGLKSDLKAPITLRGAGGETRNWPAIVTGLTIGPMRLPDRTAAVLPFDLPEIAGQKTDGLLGMDILGKFEIDLNLPQKRVGLYLGQVCPAEVLPVAGRPIAIEPAGLRRGRMVIEVQLDGRTLSAMLDTGNDRTIVMTEAVLPGGLTREMLARDPVVNLRGAGPDITAARLHRFAGLAIGPERFGSPQVQVMNRQGDEDDMIIGSDYLASRRLWLAYPRQKLFLIVPAAPAG